jgi:two-component system response regulator NreC
MAVIKVMLVDDHAIVRQGVRAVLTATGGFDVVGEAEDGREALGMARELAPDVVVMDLVMPVLNGIEATRQIKKAIPGTSVVVLTMHADEKYVFQALKAGASGYVLKSGPPSEIARAIESVQGGNPYFSPSISRKIMESYLSEEEPEKALPKGERLTAREREVLQLIAEGYTNSKIAHLMGISVKTVETHRTHIMNKLDVHDVAGLVKYSIKKGLIII